MERVASSTRRPKVTNESLSPQEWMDCVVTGAGAGGVGSIYIDASRVIVVTNKIEGHRLLNEEMNGLQSEITVRSTLQQVRAALTEALPSIGPRTGLVRPIQRSDHRQGAGQERQRRGGQDESRS